jgi:hypothetical protein
MQRYRLSKPSSMPSKDGWFTPTASMAILGEKLGTHPWIGQSPSCGLGWEPFFSREVTLSIVVDDFTKDCYALSM